MITLRRNHIAPALAALACLSFTNAPVATVAADSTWEAVSLDAVAAEFQAPQDPSNGKKVAVEDESTSLFGWNDLAQTSWPGLSTVGGLSTLPNSPLSGNSSGNAGNGGGNNPTPVTPVNPWVPPLTPGSVMPAAPNQPLSQYQP